MTRTAFCRKSPRVPRVCWLGSWALGTSDREGGQDKANWRSRTRRPSAVEKPLSAHWFLEARRLALRRHFDRGRLAPFKLFEEFQRAKRWRSRSSVRMSPHFIRSRARRCDFLRSTYSALARLRSDEIVSSWRRIKATIFMCGLDAWATAGPGSIRAAICGPNLS